MILSFHGVKIRDNELWNLNFNFADPAMRNFIEVAYAHPDLIKCVWMNLKHYELHGGAGAAVDVEVPESTKRWLEAMKLSFYYPKAEE